MKCINILVICLTLICSCVEPIDNDWLYYEDCDVVRYHPNLNLPLSVKLYPSGEKWKNEIEQGIDYYNSKLGFEMFVLTGTTSTDEFDPYIIYIEEIEDLEDGHIGQTHMNYVVLENRMCFISNINIQLKLVKNERYNLVRHELGHALGLEHDFLSESIMTQRKNRSCNGDECILTQHDVKLLRGVYLESDISQP